MSDVTPPITPVTYADSAQLHALGDFLDLLDEAADKTGWAAAHMMITLNEGTEDEITIGVWHLTGGYAIELR